MDINIWCEKYRPTDLSQVVGRQEYMDKMREYIAQKEIPHLLLVGPPGVGKSTVAKILAKAITSNIVYINASSCGVDVIRTKVDRFCRTVGIGENEMKIIILDEFDYISRDAQALLRNMMEAFAANNRFILTANYPKRIIDPIKSRCQTFEFGMPDFQEVVKVVIGILRQEGIAITQDILRPVAKMVKQVYPDIRKAINMAQKHTHIQADGSVVFSSVEEMPEIFEELYNLIYCGNLEQIRHVLSTRTMPDYSALYAFLFNRIFEDDSTNMTRMKVAALIMTADYMRYDAEIADRYVNFIAYCCQFKQLMET